MSLLNYKDQWETRRQQLRRQEPTGTMVGLLIDKNVLGKIQILCQIDCNEDKTTMNAVELKRHGYEERIQGINKVVVELCFSDTGRIATKGPVSIEESMVAQWKIKKRITVGTVELIQEMNTVNNGESCKCPKISQTQFVGDWKDSPQMQERNWRWMPSLPNQSAFQWKTAM